MKALRARFRLYPPIESLEGISQTAPQQDHDATELNEAKKVDGVVLPAIHQSTKVVQPGEEAFDLPASTVAAQRASILGLHLAVAAVRCDQFDPALGELRGERVAVVGLVPDQALGEFRDEAGFEGRDDEPDFSWRSTGHVDGERKTMAVRNCHEL